MHAVIFANGFLDYPYSPGPDDYLIAANGGAGHCIALGLQPEVVIGDLDSLEPEHLDLLKSQGVKIIAHPKRKDFTDLELALEHAQSLHADEITILGALGGRWDQTIANILLPIAFSSTPIKIIEKDQEIYFIHSDEQRQINGTAQDIVSLIPLAENATGVTTSGLEYPLDNETLYLGSTRGVSNVLLGERATIQLTKGLLLCVVIHI